MPDEYLSIEEVAGMLDLHPKTVRGFVADGRLRASRAGRKWRVRRRDVELFLSQGESGTGPTGRGDANEPAAEPGDGTARMPDVPGSAGAAQTRRERSVNVSAVIDIESIDAEEAMRISSTVLAVLNSKDPGYGRTRYDHVYYPQELRAQYIFWGGTEFVGNMLRLLTQLMRPETDETEEGRP